MSKKEFKKVLSPKFRVSFPQVFEAKSMEPGQDPFYSICMLFPKTFEKEEDKKAYEEMRQLVLSCIVGKWGADKTAWPKNLRSPFRDGSEKEYDGYGPDVIFCNAKSKMKPGLVDQNVKPIISKEDFYAGCYARATLTAYAYDNKGNKGVAFGLQNIQKLADGEPFAARSNASNDFQAVAGGNVDLTDATAAFASDDLDF